ncbi:U-box domain-containing protein 15 [Dichanthelium oligosanthes]|uniref:RING-type E3 ubiquitin transferase n=1 Tax=Dichanthelium oligosanthes TaxID=888268 RepID=A0A1E5VRY1_9POAL|nr:U-box domain-containing protein 15 [Dichanthelium oligosanthes]
MLSWSLFPRSASGADAALEPEPEPSEPSGRQLSDEALVEELLTTVAAARSFQEFRRSQRKECFSLLRWLQLVLPLIQEIRETPPSLTDDAYRRLALLGRTFQAARRLLRCCHDGSKIFLALESEAVLGRFRAVYEKMNLALDGMPYSEIGISDEVKEQVELINAQLKRCQKRTDTQDMELSMDFMMILQNEDGNADRAILERLAKKLELQSLADLRAETMAIKKLINERNGQQPESTKHIIELLNKFKEIAGIDEKNILGDVSIPKYLEKCPSLMIPNDFLCPISLEIMTDPVIIASGRTYERRSIQKWLDAGQRTCPKTQQPLAHLSLAPNFALKNLILQWCEKNKVEIQMGEPEPAAEQEERKEDIPSLVKDLSSVHLDVQRKAAKKIRTLSKENPENRALILENGGLPALISLVSYPDKKIQENTVTALLNLSIDETNKVLIAKGGAIPLIIEVLKNGSVEGQENSAAALFSLSMIDENKAAIGILGGIAPLVDLLREGTIRGKKDAATAIFNLILNHPNKFRAIEAGIVATLLKILGDKKLGMIDEALSIFLLLASHPSCRGEVGSTSFVEILVEITKEGTPKNKECALSVLLELGLNNNSLMVQALGLGLNEHLSDIAKTGTSRAQRKANSLIQLARKCS